MNINIGDVLQIFEHDLCRGDLYTIEVTISRPDCTWWAIIYRIETRQVFKIECWDSPDRTPGNLDLSHGTLPADITVTGHELDAWAGCAADRHFKAMATL